MSEPRSHPAFSALLPARRASVCPVCLARVPARHEAEGDTVYIVKRCPEHGEFRAPVWRGTPAITSWSRPKLPTPPAPESAPRQGCPYDCGLCAQHRQHTCTVLLEITSRCNLHCAYCFASAGENHGQPDISADLSYADIVRLMDAVRQASGPCNVQLSGGEPTMRDDLCELVAAAKARFPFVQLNTNGLRIARDITLAKRLAGAGLDSVFLQFDGTTDAIHTALRGAPLLEEKCRAIRLLGEAGIGVVLVPTVVPGVNDHNIGALLQFAAGHSPIVRGLHFQPVSHFGRYPHMECSPGGPPDSARITLPEIMCGMETQTNGLVSAEDFLPPGCEHALCSFHANYLVREDGSLQRLSVRRSACSCEPKPASEGADASKAFVRRQWSAPSQPAAHHENSQTTPIASSARQGTSVPVTPKVGCCGENTHTADQSRVPNDLEQFLSRAATHVLAISAMAFQDVWNLDLERLQGCCIHVAVPELAATALADGHTVTGGRLVPFCAWNCTAADGTPLHRPARTFAPCFSEVT